MRSEPEKAVLVGICRRGEKLWEAEDSLAELVSLAKSAGAAVVDTVCHRLERIDPRTLITRGRVELLAERVRGTEASLVIFDTNLAPNQQFQLATAVDAPVIDRSGLILDIFAQRAHTREGQLQVELAQLEYQLPRLRRLWPHLSRTGGGIGTRGPGETQLEVDRRKVRERISRLRKEVAAVGRTRRLQRQRRRESGMPLVGLVGYTNAGKSTLMNQLTDADVLVENKLFATLDPTVRRCPLPGDRVVLLSDTVGFIRRLPPQLIAAFHATLEEIGEADLLLEVIDVSHPQAEAHLHNVQETLAALGAASIPRIRVFNKLDLLRDRGEAEGWRTRCEGSVVISSLSGEGVPELKLKIGEWLSRGRRRVTLVVPGSRADLLDQLRRSGAVVEEWSTGDGVQLTAEVPLDRLDWYRAYLRR